MNPSIVQRPSHSLLEGFLKALRDLQTSAFHNLSAELPELVNPEITLQAETVFVKLCDGEGGRPLLLTAQHWIPPLLEALASIASQLEESTARSEIQLLALAYRELLIILEETPEPVLSQAA